MIRLRPWTLIACSALALAACGGDDGTRDALATYRNQKLAWSACDPSILGQDNDGTRALWAQLGDRLQCADMRAPLDYETPARGEVSVALLRVAAAQPERRRGAFVFNPGGPGGDGLSTPFSVVKIMSRGNPADALGALQLRLVGEYDMVGFSPRGVGASTRFECATNELQHQIFTGPASRQAPGYFDNIAYDQRKRSEACHKNVLARYINTDATARDMDLLRGLLGEARLNYIGYSYGTWLGSWYASLFPDRVGRMLLDSSTDFTSPMEEMNTTQPPARQKLLDEVLAPYAARHADIFNLGTDAAQIGARAQALLPAIQEVIAPPLSKTVYVRESANGFLDILMAAQGLDALWRAHPGADEDALHQAIEAHVFNPANPAQNLKARTLAHNYWHAIVKRRTAQPESIAMGSDDAVFLAIRCNDSPTNPSAAYWRAMSERYNQDYPLFGGVIDQVSCLYWGGPAVTRPPLAAMAGLDVMIAQSQYDAATATPGALRSFAALPAARLVYVPGDFQHALFPYEDTCVDGAVTRYLLGETPAARTTECPAKPLDLDKPPATAQDATKSSQPTGTYLDPEGTHALIQEFKRSIGRAGGELK